MSSWFIRHGRAFFRGGAPSTIEALPDNMVKITIPTTATWKPGQHFFARFLDLGIHAATSHPFTAASLSAPVEKDGVRAVELYARARGGITARLDALARAGSLKTSKVVLDGPYGGIEGNLEAYDRVLLLGGGSGTCTCLSAGSTVTDILTCVIRCDVRHPTAPRPCALVRSGKH